MFNRTFTFGRREVILSIVGVLVCVILVILGVKLMGNKDAAEQADLADSALPPILQTYIEDNRELNTMYIAGTALYGKATKEVKGGATITTYFVSHLVVNDPEVRYDYSFEDGDNLIEDSLSYLVQEGERYIPQVFVILENKEGKQTLEVY